METIFFPLIRFSASNTQWNIQRSILLGSIEGDEQRDDF